MNVDDIHPELALSRAQTEGKRQREWQRALERELYSALERFQVLSGADNAHGNAVPEQDPAGRQAKPAARAAMGEQQGPSWEDAAVSASGPRGAPIAVHSHGALASKVAHPMAGMCFTRFEGAEEPTRTQDCEKGSVRWWSPVPKAERVGPAVAVHDADGSVRILIGAHGVDSAHARRLVEELRSRAFHIASMKINGEEVIADTRIEGEADSTRRY